MHATLSDVRVVLGTFTTKIDWNDRMQNNRLKSIVRICVVLLVYRDGVRYSIGNYRLSVYDSEGIASV